MFDKKASNFLKTPHFYPYHVIMTQVIYRKNVEKQSHERFQFSSLGQ